MHILSPVTDTSDLNQQKGENNHGKDFMTNYNESYVPELGFKLVTPGYAIALVKVLFSIQNY